MHQAALDFIAITTTKDASEHSSADHILDTNVCCELYSIKDLLLELEKHGLPGALTDPRFRYRAHRLKHSLVLAWWLSRKGIGTSSLGAEQLDIVAGKLAPLPGEPGYSVLSFCMTKSFVHVIKDLVLGPSWLGALVNVDHHKLKDDADDEILRVASIDRDTVITWEGYQEDGTFSADPHKLRNRCKAAGVPTFTPEEYLQKEGVDVPVEALAFIKACEEASWTAQWERVLDGRRDVDLLIGFYRLALFDEIDRYVSRFFGVTRSLTLSRSC